MFLSGDDQALTLVAPGILWFGLTALGAGGVRGGLAEAAPLVGWGISVIAFTGLGVLTPVPFSAVAAILAVLAIAAGMLAVRRDGRILPPGMWKMALLAVPLLLIVSARAASEWDEFSHWLPSARFLFYADGFPDGANPLTGASYPAYPYSWPLLTYLASRLSGQFVEMAGGVINVFLLLTFGLLLVRLIGLGSGRNTATPGWPLVAAGGLLATLFNPSFAQKVMLTTYADAGSAVAVGVAGVLGWLMLEAESDRRGADASRYAVQMGLVLAVLVSLKQATFVLFVLVVGAVVVAALRDPRTRRVALLRHAGAVLIPPLLVYGLWRYHVATELSGREFTIRPISGWFIHMVPQILLGMLTVLAKKGLYLALMATVVAFGLRGLVRFRTPLDRLAVIAAMVFLGYNAFLLFAYVAAFGANQAASVASFWRYNMHVGLLGVAFAAYGLAVLWRTRIEDRFPVRRLAALPVVIMIAAPLVFAPKLRFDLERLKPHYLRVSAEVAAALSDGNRVFVLDPQGSGESAMMVKYRLPKGATMGGFLSAHHGADAKTVRLLTFRPANTHVLVHSVSPAVTEVLGPGLRSGVSYLLKRDGDGWSVTVSWPYPKSLMRR